MIHRKLFSNLDWQHAQNPVTKLYLKKRKKEGKKKLFYNHNVLL